MADVEERLRELADAVVAEFGNGAPRWSKRRADRFRMAGDAAGVAVGATDTPRLEQAAKSRP